MEDNNDNNENKFNAPLNLVGEVEEDQNEVANDSQSLISDSAFEETVKSPNVALYCNNLHSNGLYSFTVFQVECNMYMATGGSDDTMVIHKLIKTSTQQKDNIAAKLNNIFSQEQDDMQDNHQIPGYYHIVAIPLVTLQFSEQTISIIKTLPNGKAIVAVDLDGKIILISTDHINNLFSQIDENILLNFWLENLCETSLDYTKPIFNNDVVNKFKDNSVYEKYIKNENTKDGELEYLVKVNFATYDTYAEIRSLDIHFSSLMLLLGRVDGLTQQLQVKKNQLEFYNQIECVHTDKVSQAFYTAPVDSADASKHHKMIISVSHDGLFHFLKKDGSKVAQVDLRDAEAKANFIAYTHEDKEGDTLQSYSVICAAVCKFNVDIVAVGLYGGSVWILNYRNSAVVKYITHHKKSVESISWAKSYGQTYLYTIGLDGQVCMYKEDNYALVYQIDLGEGLGGSTVYSLGGVDQYLLVNSVEGAVYRFQLNDLNEYETWTGSYSHLIDYGVYKLQDEDYYMGVNEFGEVLAYKV